MYGTHLNSLPLGQSALQALQLSQTREIEALIAHAASTMLFLIFNWEVPSMQWEVGIKGMPTSDCNKSHFDCFIITGAEFSLGILAAR